MDNLHKGLNEERKLNTSTAFFVTDNLTTDETGVGCVVRVVKPRLDDVLVRGVHHL